MSHFFAPPWWGKILGLLFGLMLGKLPGALLGLWLGHRFDRALAQQWQTFESRGGFRSVFSGQGTSEQSAVFFHATFAVMGHLAKASGRVSESEINLASQLMARMQLSDQARRQAQDAFREGKLAGFPLQQVLRQLRQAVSGRRDMLQFFLEVQLQVAFADGEIQHEEREILGVIASELGFSQWELDRLLTMMEAFLRQGQGQNGGQWRGEQRSQHHSQHGRAATAAGMSFDDACEILGVSAGAAVTDIKRAYRRLMAQHHPDKLEARGLPPEMKQMAKEKSQQIQQAYQVVKKRRGFK